ncbi:hypothetical protein [Chryseobacterium luteum]|uniref:hypothetical protein n=1 Tax=Chryseobacterium luteum TaxID=421531 RepID=UPI000A5E7EEE|nr:hypothetical protein [Chryseobacterium luteum]
MIGELEGLKNAEKDYGEVLPSYPKERIKFESWRKKYFPEYKSFHFKNFNNEILATTGLLSK